MSDQTGAADIDPTANLLALAALRMSPMYQAAERRRRAVGAEAMAKSNEKSSDHADIRLLIGAWEAIASAVRARKSDQDRFFKALPIADIWSDLKPAIDIIRATPCKGYAASFQCIYDDYEEWLKCQELEYRSQACGGMRAMFG